METESTKKVLRFNVPFCQFYNNNSVTSRTTPGAAGYHHMGGGGGCLRWTSTNKNCLPQGKLEHSHIKVLLRMR